LRRAAPPRPSWAPRSSRAGRQAPRAPAGSAARAARTRRKPSSRPLAFGCQTLRCGWRSARAPAPARKRFGGGRAPACRFGVPRLRRKRPDPGIELLRGELLLEPTQAGIPEVFHLVIGLVLIGPSEAQILPASPCVIHKRRRAKSWAKTYLTMRCSARSNTRPFSGRQMATKRTYQPSKTAASTAPRISRSQPHAPAGRKVLRNRRARGSSPHRVVAVDPAREKRFGLGAARRLSRKAEFEHLLRHGTRTSIAGYTFFVERRAAGRARLGMLISRRHAARATERNRIKRCIREAFRLEQGKLGSIDVLVRPPYGHKGSAQMTQRFARPFLPG